VLAVWMNLPFFFSRDLEPAGTRGHPKHRTALGHASRSRDAGRAGMWEGRGKEEEEEEGDTVGRPCTVCRHSDRHTIDRELVETKQSLRKLSAQFHVSLSALQRHKERHLPKLLKKARAADERAEAEGLRDELRAIKARVLAVLARAEAAGDRPGALAALRELRSIAQLGARSTERDDAALSTAAIKMLIASCLAVLQKYVPSDRIEGALNEFENLCGTVPAGAEIDSKRLL
jgi:hypothetical protein